MEATEPCFERSGLLTIDVQNDFTRQEGQPGTLSKRQVLPAMARLVQAYRSSGRPIVHIVRLYRPDGSNADLCRRSLICEGKQVVVPGSAGSQLVAEIRPRDDALLEPGLLLRGGIQTLAPGEEVIYKPRWGAFYATPLEEHLRSLGLDSLTICGFNFPNCPRASIYEASERDYRLVLAADGVTGLYETGMQELLDIGVRLLDVETIANLLPAG